MTLKELQERIDSLCLTPADEALPVLVASDEEGNDFHDLVDVLIDWDENDPGEPKSVTLWP